MIPSTIRVRTAAWGPVNFPLSMILRVELFRGDDSRCFILDREGRRILVREPFREVYRAVIHSQRRQGIRAHAW